VSQQRTLKVFISWSGDRSKLIAIELLSLSPVRVRLLGGVQASSSKTKGWSPSAEGQQCERGGARRNEVHRSVETSGNPSTGRGVYKPHGTDKKVIEGRHLSMGSGWEQPVRARISRAA